MKLDPQKTIEKPLVIVSGDESALRKSALEQLLEAAEVQPDDFDLQTYEGDSDPNEWIASAGTAPFLANRRTVIVRHLLRGDVDKGRATSFKLPPSALLILVADDESGDDDRQRRLKSQRTAWEKIVKENGGSQVICNIQQAEVKDLIRSEVAKSDKRISERALEILNEMSGGSASRAIEEIPKLVAYIEPEKTIQESDVREVVMPSREWNVFKLVDSVVDGDVGESLRQLRILVGSPQKAEDAAFRSILPNLSRMLRLIWQARVCVDAGVQPANAPESIKSAFPSKPNILSEQEFVRNKAIRAARRMTLSQVAEMLQVISDADVQIKGMLPNFTSMETLEQTVLKMAQIARPRLGVT